MQFFGFDTIHYHDQRMDDEDASNKFKHYHLQYDDCNPIETIKKILNVLNQVNNIVLHEQAQLERMFLLYYFAKDLKSLTDSSVATLNTLLTLLDEKKPRVVLKAQQAEFNALSTSHITNMDSREFTNIYRSFLADEFANIPELFAQRNFKRALAVINSYSQAFPNNAEAQLMQGKCLEKSGYYKKALSVYKNVPNSANDEIIQKSIRTCEEATKSNSWCRLFTWAVPVAIGTMLVTSTVIARNNQP